MPKSKGRPKAAEDKARRGQAEREASQARKLTLKEYQRRRFFGWSLVAVGVAVGVSHWLQHLGFFELLSTGPADLVIGYPMAGLLGVGGAIVLSK